MASIERRGDGWRVRWRGIDGRPRGRQCPSKRTAQDLAREVEDCIARGRDWTAAAPVAVELHDVAQAFLDDSRRYLAESSRSDRRYTLEAWMRWAAVRYPRRPMDALSRDGVAAYHAHLLGPHDGRRGLTDGSALLTVQAILRLWRWASESDRFADVVGPVRKPHLRQPAQRIRRGAPTWTDIDRVIDASAGLEWLRRAVWVARCTGLRVSQVRAMQWADVDLDAATLRVTTGKSRRERAGRVVPLAPVLVAEMARWGRREGAVAPGMADSAHAARIKARWRAVDMPEDRRAAGVDPTSTRSRAFHGAPLHATPEARRRPRMKKGARDCNHGPLAPTRIPILDGTQGLQRKGTASPIHGARRSVLRIPPDGDRAGGVARHARYLIGEHRIRARPLEPRHGYKGARGVAWPLTA